MITKQVRLRHISVVIPVELICAFHLVMVVEDVVGRHRHCANERMSRTCCERHAEPADHLHRQVSGVHRLSCHGDLTSPQDAIPLLRDDLDERMRSRR